MAAIALTVESIGARGDGIAHHEGERIFLPLTVPGDRLLAELGPKQGDGRAARVTEMLAPMERAAPACRQFGQCGGCALQHLPPDAYVAAKDGLLRQALAQHGLTAPIAPLLRLPPATRRRATFVIQRPPAAKGRPLVGFHGRASHRVVDLSDCAVLHPALMALVPALRALAATLIVPGKSASAAATLTDGGVDLLLELPAAPDLAGLERLAAFAEVQDLARLCWRTGEDSEAVPLALRRPTQVRFAGVVVDVPADGFLQASSAADEALTNAVMARVGDARNIADLFAGLGTFSFALAQRGHVHAVEGARPAVAALVAAASRAGLAAKVTTELRDLERRPLGGDELRRFDLIVFDPPRAGAKAQCRALAETPVPRLIAVSCNPATFARDARMLVDAGYRLGEIQPIDAFTWSPHLELVASFDHPRASAA